MIGLSDLRLQNLGLSLSPQVKYIIPVRTLACLARKRFDVPTLVRTYVPRTDTYTYRTTTLVHNDIPVNYCKYIVRTYVVCTVGLHVEWANL